MGAVTSNENQKPTKSPVPTRELRTSTSGFASAIFKLALSASDDDEADTTPQRDMGHAVADRLFNLLDYDSASPIEQLLIAEVVLSYSRLMACEMRYPNNPTQVYETFLRSWERRLSCASKRHGVALERLAKVQSLLAKVGVPDIHVESGGNANVLVSQDSAQNV